MSWRAMWLLHQGQGLSSGGRCFMWVQFLDSNSTAISWNLSLVADSWTQPGCRLWNYALRVVIQQAWLQVHEKKLADKSCFCCQDATQTFNNFSIDFYKNIKNSINITILQNSCGFCTFCLKKSNSIKPPRRYLKWFEYYCTRCSTFVFVFQKGI